MYLSIKINSMQMLAVPNKSNPNFKTVTFYDNNYSPINTCTNLKPYQFLSQSGLYLLQNEKK